MFGTGTNGSAVEGHLTDRYINHVHNAAHLLFFISLTGQSLKNQDRQTNKCEKT